MRDGRIEIKLSEIADIQTGPFGSQLHKEDYVTIGTPIVTVEHLGNRKFTIQNMPFVSQEDKHRLSKYVLAKGDIVFSRVGSVDRCSYVGIEEHGWMFSGRCLRVRPKKEELDSAFLYYYFTQEKIKQFVRNIAVGATMPSINTSLLGEVPVLKPSIKMQQAIAATLSCLDDKIELNNKINQNLEAQAQALFKSWFVDFEPFQNGEFVDSELGRIPKGWSACELNNLFSFIKGKKPKETYEQKGDEQEAYLTIDALNGGTTVFAIKEKMVVAEELDTLMVMDGASSGTCYFGKKGIVGSTLSKINVYEKSCSEIVHQTLKYYESYIKEHTTGSAIPHTDKKLVLQLKIALPNETKEVTQLLCSYRTKIMSLQHESQTLAALRDTLLPKLMSGEIEVPI